MKKQLLIITLVLLGLIITECAVIPPEPLPVSEFGPDVRIGIAENLASLSFETNGNIDIYDQYDRLLANAYQGSNWQVRLTDAAPINLRYRLLYREVEYQEVAERVAAKLENDGYAAVVKQIRKKQLHGTKFDNKYFYQIFLKSIFYSEDEAKRYQEKIANQFSTTILPFFDSRPRGTVILTNEQTGERFSSGGMIRVRGKLFTLKTTVGEGFHFEGQTTRAYREKLEFWIDRFGGITVVNEIPIEVYLRGVVGSEMSPQFHLEALKAQAITARGYTLAWSGNLHRLSPFDLCDEVHCHVYGGVDRESASVIEAVDQTRGQVLMYGDQICDTRYAGVCGGHSENNEDVWHNEPQQYLRGHLDLKDANLLTENYLTKEFNVRQWVESNPDVFCNTSRIPVPDYLEYTKKYFRWTIRYSREELSRIISQKTRQNIGSLTNIIPLERGVSGRIKKIELQGTRKSITIERELEIRKALSANYLYSSCFVVEREGNDFIIKGAGWGHGVGMCQTGAAMMALNGFNYRDILNHYYQNSKIVKLY